MTNLGVQLILCNNLRLDFVQLRASYAGETDENAIRLVPRDGQDQWVACRKELNKAR